MLGMRAGWASPHLPKHYQNIVKNEIINQLAISLSQIKNIPIAFLSGLHNKGIDKLFDKVLMHF